MNSITTDHPILVFDGDCAFCRFWVNRWKRRTGDKVEFVPFQELVDGGADESTSFEFGKSVFLFESGDRISSGAKAVFRVLSYGSLPVLEQLYENLPGFAWISEAAYRWVARHRKLSFKLTKASLRR